MGRFRKMITFSNVVACIALFVALGGSVYAAGRINGEEIKAKSIPGNRIKPKTLTARQVKTHSLSGVQFKANSITGEKVVESSLVGVAATSLASVQYASTTIVLNGGESGDSGTVSCPAGMNVIGGGAVVNRDSLAIVNDSGPNSSNGWEATGFGSPGMTMTITAICTAVVSVSG